MLFISFKTLLENLPICVKSRFCLKKFNTVSNKMTWENVKQKFLSMSIEEKRKNYKTSHIELKDIPTWKDYYQINKNKLSKKIAPLPGNNIDNTKNEILLDKISVYRGDITKLEIDAIANAANKSLLGGGGVDGAIHRAAGKTLVEECRSLMGCETGEAKITGGYALPAKYVIHTVGPRGEKPDLLRNCYLNCLKVLLENNLKSIAFPCISTGIYGYPNLQASHVAAYTVRKFLEEHINNIDRIIFCIFLEEDKDLYEGILQSYFPVQ
ncbi:macro domain-containing protein CT2219-like [Cylas formicarius]|uniref:macro domain-containing protein CT2219-like n=1 Tax=Cylas formicarius TaxID=197179 RepID=UPI0029589400|nr:macro domain-containing protein CT2219-like [Cylas formicarius]